MSNKFYLFIEIRSKQLLSKLKDPNKNCIVIGLTTDKSAYEIDCNDKHRIDLNVILFSLLKYELVAVKEMPYLNTSQVYYLDDSLNNKKDYLDISLYDKNKALVILPLDINVSKFIKKSINSLDLVNRKEFIINLEILNKLEKIQSKYSKIQSELLEAINELKEFRQKNPNLSLINKSFDLSLRVDGELTSIEQNFIDAIHKIKGK